MLVFAIFSLWGLQVYAQNTVTGTVTDDAGEALPGVSVLVKGTTVGTMTLADGTYSVAVPDGSTTLVFSYIGMATKEVEITGNVVDVILAPAETEFEEVVVTALGIKREKRELTYQTTNVSSDDLVSSAPSRVAAGLVGKVAGLQINIQDNGVNPSNKILLRGLRSISQGNEALIVIDGSIASQEAFDDLNPNDIESINVLKGATAAALYGSDASNGALIVTTKKGSLNEKLTVGLMSSLTFEQVAYMPDFQTEYGTGWEGAYDAVENTNWGPRFDGTMRRIGPDFPADYPLTTQMVPYAPVANNLRDFFQTGNTLSNTVYLSGGNESGNFYLSIGDQRSKGIVIDDQYRRNNVRVNASKKLGKVTLSSTINFLTDKTDVVGNTIGDQDRPLYWFLLNTSANIPLSTYSDWSNPLSYGYADNYYNAYYQNPYWAIGTNRNVDYSNRINGNFSIDYDILGWLKFTARGGLNNSWGQGKNWRAYQDYDSDLQPAHTTVSSFVEDSEFQSQRYNFDAMLSGNYDITDMISLKAVLGATTEMKDWRQSQIRANNLSIEGFYDVSNGTGTPEVAVLETAERQYGFFGDFVLGYSDFVFLNFSGRNDWTSTLAVGNNSYFYPAFGISFVPTSAIGALKDNNILSYAKITVSNSTVYNAFQPYAINERYYQSAGFPFGEVNGFFLDATAVDVNIRKEKLNTTEIGLNLAFLKSRISLDASYFMTKTTDLITNTTPSVASGSTAFRTNIGELQSTGLELALTGRILNMKDLKWDLTANFTKYETVVVEIKEGLDEIALWTSGTGYGVFAIVDEAYPQIKANTYQYDPQGRIIVDAASGAPIESEGQELMGKTTPDFILGLNSSISFKGFMVSATMDYRTGHVYYEQGSDQMEFTGRSLASVSANRQDFVIPNSVIEVSEGVFEENTNIPVSGGRQSYWTDVYNNVKSNYVKDATALKIRDLTIGYSLPKSLIKNLPIQKLRIDFVSRNLMTWLPAENQFADPEFNNTGFANDNVVGVGGFLQSPPTRSFGFNLNIEF